MDKYASLVKFGIIALAIGVVGLVGMDLKSTTADLKAATTALKSAQNQGQTTTRDRAMPGEQSATGSGDVKQFAVAEAIVALASSSGVKMEVVEPGKLKCVEDNCLANYEGVMRYLTLLSNLPMDLRYTAFCMGSGCGDNSSPSFTFEYQLID